MAQASFEGAVKVFGWSFYSQGSRYDKHISADEFIAAALTWFNDPNPSRGSSWDKGIRLAELIRREKTLLLLDGVEPLQYPPGEMYGYLKDQGMQALLKELAHFNPGLCVITSRCAIRDIQHTLNKSTNEIHLGGLIPSEGASLLRWLDVKGSEQELETASIEFKGHALALSLLGRYLFVVYSGDIKQQASIPGLTIEEEQGGHAYRVMESYEHWLGDTPERSLLYLMGLFDRPAPLKAFDVLIEEPPIDKLTSQFVKISPARWKYTLKRLRELGLLEQAHRNHGEFWIVTL